MTAAEKFHAGRLTRFEVTEDKTLRGFRLTAVFGVGETALGSETLIPHRATPQEMAYRLTEFARLVAREVAP